MGLLDKIFGKKESEGVEDLDKLLEMGEGDAVNPPAKMYVKKIPLRNEGDYDLIVREIKEGNIVIVDTRPLIKQPKRLKQIITNIKVTVEKANGDIAALNKEGSALIVTPTAVKIVKSRRKV